MNTFAQNLKRAMKTKGVTAKKLSKLTGIAPSTISEWLGGRSPTFNESLLKLSKALGIELEALLMSKENEKDIISQIISSTESANSFQTIFKGTYRITVEKHSDD